MKPTPIKFSIYLYGCQIISYIVYREKNKSQELSSYLVSREDGWPVSQFTGYPVEELKSGWLTVLTNSYLVTKKLYLKLTSRINCSTGKPGNWVTN